MKSVQFRYINKWIYAVFIFLLWPLNACQNNEVVIPYAQVNFTIDLNDPEFYDLKAIGNAIEVNGGVNGIIIFRQNINTDQDFVAFDCTCTNDPDFRCKVELTAEKPGYGECECCHSEFNLFGGYFEAGPAVYPLKTYSVYYNPNTDILTVSNF